MEHGLEEQGFLGFARNEGRAEVAALQRGAAGVESEGGLLLIRAMATDAAVVEQRVDAFKEVAVRVGEGRRFGQNAMAIGHDREEQEPGAGVHEPRLKQKKGGPPRVGLSGGNGYSGIAQPPPNAL
jgi:hypothetical protein